MDLDTALSSLYEVSREEFVPTRDDLVRKARSSGDRELASKIAVARKPTVAAWLINQVAREYPDDLTALAELSDALRGAHQQLAADRLRTLSQQRNELLRTIDDRTLRVARRAKMTVTDQVAEQVREAFTAAVLDQDVLADLRTGRLSTVPDADANAGWPTWDGIPATTPATPARPKPSAAPPKKKSTKDEEEARRRAAAERRAALRREAEEDAEEAESALAEAEAALSAAKQRAEDADAELAAARSRVEQARFEQRTAKQAAAAAQHEYEQAERSARAARRTVTDLG